MRHLDLKPLGEPSQQPAEPADEAGGRPRVAMLGLGWFPATLGGLDRYYRALFEQLPEASGVVIGPAADAPRAIEVVDGPDRPLPRRLLGFWRAARRAARGAEVVDAHFALYAAAPLLLGPLRSRPTVCHFHGPWAEENVAAGDASDVRLTLRRTLGAEGAPTRRRPRRALRRLSQAARRALPRAPVGDPRLPAGGRAGGVHPGGPRRGARANGCGPRGVRRRLRQAARAAHGSRHPARRVGRARRAAAGGLDAAGDRRRAAARDALLARCSRPPLAGRVRVEGRVSDAELVDAYRCADVAVVPTLAVEGFGLVVLEAAACGTPSIVSDVGGLPEAAAALDPSLVVPAGDAAGAGRTPAERRAGRPSDARRHAPPRRALRLAGGRRATPRPATAAWGAGSARRACGSSTSTTSPGSPGARSRCCACCRTCGA